MELLLTIYIFWWSITRIILIADFNAYMIKNELEYDFFVIGFMLLAVGPPFIGDLVFFAKLLATK